MMWSPRKQLPAQGKRKPTTPPMGSPISLDSQNTGSAQGKEWQGDKEEEDGVLGTGEEGSLLSEWMELQVDGTACQRELNTVRFCSKELQRNSQVSFQAMLRHEDHVANRPWGTWS